jgi:hypothetical protein
MPLTTPTAQHFVPVALHHTVPSLHGMDVPGHAVVGIMSAQHPVAMAHLFLDWYVPYASPQVAQVCKATLES